MDARSRASAEGIAGDVTEPGVGMVKAVDGLGSIGRRGARSEMAREAEGPVNLHCDEHGVGNGGISEAYRGVAEGLRRVAGVLDGRATALRQRRAFMMGV